MRLYYSPGACSLADHIALHEAGLDFEHVKVDLKAKTTERGEDFAAINPKSYVPALVLDSGELLSENIAILDWIAHQTSSLKPQGPLGHTHLLEALAFISTEIHKGFAPFFKGATDEVKATAKATIEKRFAYIVGTMQGDYLFGTEPGVADCYLFVTTLWAGKMGVDLPPELSAFRDRMMTREAVQTAMTHEGLI